MKARFENNTIVLYAQLPQSFKNDDVCILGGMENLSKEEQENLGFYDVIEPELGPMEMYGPVKWDAGLNSFIYEKRTKPITVQKTLTKYQFLSRFTPTERLAIITASKQLPEVELFWEMFKIAEEIDLTNTETIAGVQMLEKLKLIEIGRALEILMMTTPVLVDH